MERPRLAEWRGSVAIFSSSRGQAPGRSSTGVAPESVVSFCTVQPGLNAEAQRREGAENGVFLIRVRRALPKIALMGLQFLAPWRLCVEFDSHGYDITDAAGTAVLRCAAMPVFGSRAVSELPNSPPGLGLRQSSGALEWLTRNRKRQRPGAVQDAAAPMPSPGLLVVPRHARKRKQFSECGRQGRGSPSPRPAVFPNLKALVSPCRNDAGQWATDRSMSSSGWCW